MTILAELFRELRPRSVDDCPFPVGACPVCGSTAPTTADDMFTHFEAQHPDALAEIRRQTEEAVSALIRDGEMRAEVGADGVQRFIWMDS